VGAGHIHTVTHVQHMAGFLRTMALLPLSPRGADEEDSVMTIRRAPSTLLLIESEQHGHLVTATHRPWMSLLARVCGNSLDRQLACGVAPEAHPVLAVRSQWLVSAPVVAGLARDWVSMVERARRGPTSSMSFSQLCCARVIASARAAETLIAALRAPLPPVRGLAMANVLLTDGTGPLYNSRSEINLQSALLETIAQLDPLLVAAQ
jgi:hypothetical protein